MSNFLVPNYRATDTNGAPISGAKLYFYETGTTTPLDTYSDSALTSANTNPLEADGGGYFGRIYLQEDAYRVVLTDADDVTIKTWDDVQGSVLNNVDLVTRLRQVATNPLDYGAIGDGAADESSYVQQAIDDATGVVDLLGKTFKCNTGLVGKSGIVIRNGTLDFSACDGNYGIQLVGTTTSRGLLANNAAVKATQLVMVSADGIAVDDLILLRKSSVWSSSLGDSGELLRVSDVTDDTVTIAGRIRDTYNTANDAAVDEITPVKQVIFENVTFIGNRSASGDLYLIDARYCDGLYVRGGCSFTGIKNSAIRLQSCINVNISSSAFLSGAATAHGVDVRGASQDVFIGPACSFFDIGGNGVRIGENAAANDYVSRSIQVLGCSFVGCTTNGVLVADMAQNVRIYGCNFEAADGDGVGLTGADDVSIFGCGFRGNEDGITTGGFTANFSAFGNYYAVDGEGVEGGLDAVFGVAGSAQTKDAIAADALGGKAALATYQGYAAEFESYNSEGLGRPFYGTIKLAAVDNLPTNVQIGALCVYNAKLYIGTTAGAFPGVGVWTVVGTQTA